jgi:NTP pyrophosphatase (non-canonical NTP hydrolase)
MKQSLEKIFKDQILYNQLVRKIEHPDNYEYWMKQYLLGAISEVNEILQEINWKIHRRGKPLNRNNLAMELADLTKFVFCMWEWSGYTSDDMLKFVQDKNEELASQWKQDFVFKVPPNSNVVICDLDGTIGDWRQAFQNWLNKEGVASDYDSANTMAMEVDINIPFGIYSNLKEKFEAEGGYGDLPVYKDGVDTLKDLAALNTIVISYTARPAGSHSRIWLDSWRWFDKIGLGSIISELRIGAEARITRAISLKIEGHKVVMFEDDPSLALRAANAGIHVIMRAHNYNAGVQHTHIERTNVFNAKTVFNMFGLQELK